MSKKYLQGGEGERRAGAQQSLIIHYCFADMCAKSSNKLLMPQLIRHLRNKTIFLGDEKPTGESKLSLTQSNTDQTKQMELKTLPWIYLRFLFSNSAFESCGGEAKQTVVFFIVLRKRLCLKRKKRRLAYPACQK